MKNGNLLNQAFIDGQNLHLGTTKSSRSWDIDFAKFRYYLTRKYKVDKAYYFLGYFKDGQRKLYSHLQESGFILIFREHNPDTISAKKGNVDTDIVFTIMEKLYKKEKMNKVFLVSGDGDYYRLVRFLRDEGRLGKIMFPSRRNASSLYRQIEQRYRIYLDDKDLKTKIILTKRAQKKKN